MSKRTLHKPQALVRPECVSWDAPPDALERWAERPLAAEADDPATISVYEPIGSDSYGDAFSAKRMAGALRSIGARDVTVNLNSPGGDLFEGIAIYNLLAEHPGAVRVRVMGIAASAASVIAMAGDEIQMGAGAHLMIHNCWGLVLGNANDLTAVAAIFSSFDGAMADIYVARTGLEREKVTAMMDAETYMAAPEAVSLGFATGTFEAPESKAMRRPEQAARIRLDALLARQGVPRAERRRLLRDASGMPSAAADDTPSAAVDISLALAAIRTLKNG